MSYTVIITEEIAANVAVTTQNYPITIEYNATNIAAGTTYGNSNVSTLLASFGSNSISTTGNVTAGYFIGDGSQLTGLPGGLYGNADVASYLASGADTANIVTTGNVQGAYILGNGSALSAITGANVTGTVANATYAASAGTATTAGTANVALIVAGANVSGAVAQATQAGTANVANSVAGANVTGVVAQATQANAANTAVTVTNAAQGNITSVGTLTGLSVSGNVTAGNLQINTDAVITGNLTVNGTTTTINSNVVTVNDKTFVLANNQSTGAGVDGSGIVAGNPTVASILYNNATGAWVTNIGLTATGDLSATGNVIATGFSGSGAALTSITGANVTGNVSSALFAINAGTASAANTAGTATFADTANAVAGANVSGTVANATYATTAGSATTATTATTAGTVTTAAQGNITSVGTLTSLSASGNISTGNLIASPGTGTGNITITTSQTPTISTGINPGRIFIGNSYTGNSDGLSVNYDPYSRMRQARVTVNDRYTRGEGNINSVGLTNVLQMELTANVSTGTLSRSFAGINFLHVGGGSSGYSSTITSPAAFVAMNGLVYAGTLGNVAVGNISMATATGGLFGTQINGGGNVGNALGVISTHQMNGTTSAATNLIGFAPWMVTTGTPSTTPTNFNVFYNPAASSTYGSLINGGWARSATNYYAFKNDDDVASVQLGSLRRYHEFQYTTATSGTINIDKNNGQVQYLNLAGNVTIGDFQNFVTTANDSVNNDTQSDTVTLIIQQGATPYTVTLPTGNASIKYANAVSTVGTTANSVTMISVTAFRSAANAAVYLTTVSPGFV